MFVMLFMLLWNSECRVWKKPSKLASYTLWDALIIQSDGGVVLAKYRTWQHGMCIMPDYFDFSSLSPLSPLVQSVIQVGMIGYYRLKQNLELCGAYTPRPT